MPLERHIDDLTACDGIKFWMSDGERPVLCRVSHEALRDLAERVHFEGTDEKVFEAYRELIEQVASDAYDAGTSFDDAGLVLVTSASLSANDKLGNRPAIHTAGSLAAYQRLIPVAAREKVEKHPLKLGCEVSAKGSPGRPKEGSFLREQTLQVCPY